jgi:DNA invertase Pin-like site-specific DNA recombinase
MRKGVPRKITGTTADRPQLAKLMKALASGDVVITPAVDRCRATPPTFW